MSDDVLTRAKTQRDRYLSAGWDGTAGPLVDLIALAELQAQQLAEIREDTKWTERYEYIWGPAVRRRILAITDRGN